MININKIPTFKKWLKNNGAEILPVTSHGYELLRFKCCYGTGIVYTGKKGITTVGPVDQAYECFIKNKSWRGNHIEKRKPNKQKARLLVRDGPCCFYCKSFFPVDKLTVEHILALISGGVDRIENKALSCDNCNDQMDNLPIVEKIALRDLKLSNIPTEEQYYEYTQNFYR